MTLKSRSALTNQANTTLPDNEGQEISPADVRDMIKDVIDSFISKSGDTGILGLLQYVNNFAITDDNQLVYAGWVNAQIFAITGFKYYKGNPLSPIAGDIREGYNYLSGFIELQQYDGINWIAAIGRLNSMFYGANRKIRIDVNQMFAYDINEITSIAFGARGLLNANAKTVIDWSDQPIIYWKGNQNNPNTGDIRQLYVEASGSVEFQEYDGVNWV